MTEKSKEIAKTKRKPSPRNGIALPDSPGRPKGVPNKSTIEFKLAVTKLIEYATPQMVSWLEAVAAEDPSKALDHLYKFAQFGYPLLARTDTVLSGPNGSPVEQKVTIEFVRPKVTDS